MLNDAVFDVDIELEDPYDLDIDSDDYDVDLDSTIEVTVPADYNTLENKPTINGVTIEGDLTSTDIFVDLTYTHVQNQASNRWEIPHNLNKYPSVTVVDSAGNVVVGDVRYTDVNNVVIVFQGAFSGSAYLN